MAARKDGLYAVLGEWSNPAVLKTAERNAPIVRIDYTALAGLAQLAEQLPCKHQV